MRGASDPALAALLEIDPLRHYLGRAKPAFEAAQESAARLAGLLVTAEMQRSRHALDWESRGAGRQRLAEAQAALAELAVPERAAHFHHHLGEAAVLLDIAWRAAQDQKAGLVAAADPLPPLRAAWQQIRFASRAMPGFETVDFRNSCCAMHRS